MAGHSWKGSLSSAAGGQQKPPSGQTEAEGAGLRSSELEARGGSGRQKRIKGRAGAGLSCVRPCGQPAAAAAAGGSETDAVLCQKYRELARHYLRGLPALFERFTGLFAHMAWAPTWPGRWSARSLPTHSHVCRQVVAGDARRLARCRACAARHLVAALKSGHPGHRFTCFLGVHNFWLPIAVRGCTIGLAFVQALALPAAGASSRRPPPRPARALASKTTAAGGRQVAGGARRRSLSDFCEAARLLQLFFQHVETSTLADLRRSDLAQAQQALVALQTVATRLRGELNGLVPAVNKAGPVPRAQEHPEQAVRAALDRINEGYASSITLKQCAAQLGLNAAYLSSLFSRSVGMPFKTYLTEVRMEKAKELLSNPANTASAVASAVGFASENRFRVAFKKVAGLPPSLWRETLRMLPPQP